MHMKLVNETVIHEEQLGNDVPGETGIKTTPTEAWIEMANILHSEKVHMLRVIVNDAIDHVDYQIETSPQSHQLVQLHYKTIRGYWRGLDHKLKRMEKNLEPNII